MTASVDITNPVPPEWYVENSNLAECVELVRNGNAVFWRIEVTHPDRPDPLAPIQGPPVTVPDFGLFLPGSGYTPKGATLFGPPAGRAGLSLPGIPQHDPSAPDYPVVQAGSVVVNIAGSGLSFRLV